MIEMFYIPSVMAFIVMVNVFARGRREARVGANAVKRVKRMDGQKQRKCQYVEPVPGNA
jgi:hypothetical protein